MNFLSGLGHWVAGVWEVEKPHWEYCLFLFTLVWELQPELVYEIGVRHGNSTRAILNGLRRSGGKLLSCDKKDCAKAVKSPELRARWEFFKMTSSAFAAQLTEPAGLVYIDGDHQFSQVRDDVIAFWPLLKPGGLMVLDDTTSHPEGPGYVIQILREGGLEAFNLSGYTNGIGLIRKGADSGLA